MLQVHFRRTICTTSAVKPNEKVSESARPQHSSGRAKVPPLGQCGGSAILECLPVAAAFRVEVIVDGAVQRGESLQTSHPPEAGHRPFTSSERLVAVLRLIVHAAPRLALASHARNRHDGTIQYQPSRIDCFGATMPEQWCPQEFKRSLLAALLRHVAFECFGVDSTPAVMLHAIDLSRRPHRDAGDGFGNGPWLPTCAVGSLSQRSSQIGSIRTEPFQV